MKGTLVTTYPLRVYIILSFLGLIGIDLSAQTCLSGYSNRDSLDFTIALGSCEVSEEEILNYLGLEPCGSDVSLSVSSVGLNQSRSVDLISEVSDEIVDNFVVTVVPDDQMIPSNISIEVSPFDCVLDKNYIFSRLNIDTSSLGAISTIHFISGTARITQFIVGDTIYIDRIVCGDGYVYDTDIKIYLFPDFVLANDAIINYEAEFTTELFDIERILTFNPNFKYIDKCDIDRLTIDNLGPFGFGLNTVGDVFLDKAELANNLRINVLAPTCPPSLLNLPIAPDQCYINKNDILDTIGFDNTIDDYNLISVVLSDGHSFEDETFTIEQISVRGVVICNQPIEVSYTRPTDISLVADNFACNDVLNISLDGDCSIELSSDILLENRDLCFLNFIVTAEKPEGTVVAQDHSIILNEPGTYKVSVTDPRSSLTCWSTVHIEDKHIYDVVCPPDTIACHIGTIPMPDTSDAGIRFPFVGTSSEFISIGNNEYSITNDDQCGIKYGRYIDIEKNRCIGDYSEIVERHWTFEDLVGNQDTCIQYIYVIKTPLDSVDKFDQYTADCLSDFELLDDNGLPSPMETGFPTIGGGSYHADICGTLKKTYSDNVFELCGKSQKIIREWLIIDWCTDEVLTLNQTILIEDQRPPILLDSLPDVVLNTHPFLCGAEDIMLPEPMVEDCGSEAIDLQILYETYNVFGEKIVVDNGDNLFIPSISMTGIEGQFNVEYIFTDECANVLRDTISIYIEDNQPPVAVCDQHTAISIAGNGQAQVKALTFDDLSVDNCGIAKYEARKLDGICDITGEYTELILFCCEEVGQTITVEFRVTDIAGNINTCQVFVDVFDKFVPIIICPEDITIDCADDYTDLDITGMANAIDNCMIDSLYYDDVAALDECGKGTIIRTWHAEDTGDQVASCEQIITIHSDIPFAMSADRFPGDTVAIGCLSTVDPDFTGRPDLSGASCAQAEATYEDTYFNEVQNGCFKIIREWIVIDWCQYSTSQPENGYWSMAQAIKIQNESAPEIVNLPTDTTLCLTGDDCMDFFTIEASAIDDCSQANDLDWFYEIRTTGSEIQVLKTSTSNNLSAQLPTGTYLVIFTVSDGCDNYTSKDMNVTIEDCQAPTINCPNTEGSGVLDQNGQAIIFISDFDIEIEDNCSATEGLSMSFSPDEDINTLIFDCQDISNGISESRLVSIYVTDEAGNISMCEAPLEIFDSSADFCQDLEEENSNSVTGQIFTEELVGTDNVAVSVTLGSQVESQTTTDVSGTFSFGELRGKETYEVALSRYGRYDDGVTTLDLLLIQRHILGLGILDSPYKILAADVDNSNRITGGDLVKLRRIILGIDSDFGGEQDNWIFLPGDHEFVNPYVPFSYPETITFNTNTKEINLEIISVKVGDVNGSNEVSSRFKANSRSLDESRLTIGQAFDNDLKTERYIPVYSSESEIFGFQLGLSLQRGHQISHIHSTTIDIDSQHTYIDGNQVKISWNANNETVVLDDQEPLFYVVTNSTEAQGQDLIVDPSIEPLWINNEYQEQDITLEYDNDLYQGAILSDLTVGEISPNPFIDQTRFDIEMTAADEVIWTIYDTRGKRLYQGQSVFSKGTHSISIDAADLGLYRGIMFLHIASHNRTIVRKIVRP